MNNFNYVKKYKNLLFYFVIAFPLLLVLFSLVSYNSQFTAVFELVSDFFRSLLNMPINNWYLVIVNAFNFDITNDLISIFITLPLFVFWYYLIYLVLIVLIFIPKLAIKLFNKLKGD